MNSPYCMYVVTSFALLYTTLLNSVSYYILLFQCSIWPGTLFLYIRSSRLSENSSIASVWSHGWYFSRSLTLCFLYMYKTVSYKQKLDQIKVYITLIRYEKSLKKKKKRKSILFVIEKSSKIIFSVSAENS